MAKKNSTDHESPENNSHTHFSQALLADIVNHSIDAIYSCNPEGIITSWNPGAENIYGYSGEEAIGKNIILIVPPDRVDEQKNILHNISLGRYLRHITTVRKHKDGRLIDIFLSVSPIKDIHGHIIGASKIAHDITEKKRMESHLIESEKKYRTLFENNPMPMWVLDVATDKFLSVNEAAINHYGYSREEFYNLTALDIRPEGEREIYLKREKKLHVGPHHAGIWKHRKKNGTEIIVEIYADDIIYNDRPARLILSNDITERKKAEEEFSREKELSDSTINSLPGVFYMFNDKLQFLRWNKNFELVSGYSSEEIARMQPLDFFEGEEKQYVAERIGSVFTTGMDEVEAHFVTKSKEKIPYYFNGQLTDFKGEPCVIGMGIDITTRKKAEEEIANSEKRFRETLDKLMEGMQIIGFNWQYLYVNEAIAKQSRYPKDELLGSTMLEKFPGFEQTETFVTLQRSMVDRISQQVENYFTFPDGSKAWFELSIQPVPEGIFILSIDISEQKKTEEDIQKAETSYREIFEKGYDSIYVHDIETGRVLEVNQKASEVTGYTKEELLNKNPMDFITGHPDYSLEKAMSYIQKAAAGIPQEFEWLGKNRNGNSNWFEVNLKRASIAGVDRVLAFFRLIDDRKKAEETLRESEESFRFYVTASSDIVYKMSADWKTMYNLEGKDFLTSTTMANNGWIYNYIPEFERPKVLEAIERAIANKEMFALEHQLFDVNGELAWTYSRAIPRLNEKGEIIEWVGAANNITERKKAEKEIQERNDQLRNLSSHLQTIREEERIHIAREIHDELGQQLTAMKLDIASLKNKLKDPSPEIMQKTEDLISVANSSIRTIRKIITELRPGILDDLGLLAALEWQAKEFGQKNHIICHFLTSLSNEQFSDDINTAVFRIFQESLTNITRHAEATSVKANLYTTGGMLVLEIMDNGKGITTERKNNKTSFGLLGMRERAKMLKGEFDIQPQSEGGTIVTLKIPFSS